MLKPQEGIERILIQNCRGSSISTEFPLKFIPFFTPNLAENHGLLKEPNSDETKKGLGNLECIFDLRSKN